MTVAPKSSPREDQCLALSEQEEIWYRQSTGTEYVAKKLWISKTYLKDAVISETLPV
jgi:hypothetical protein